MLSSLLVSLFLSGCATTAIIGGKPLRTPSAGFVPAEKLSYSKDKVYTAIQQVLIEENIGVVNETKKWVVSPLTTLKDQFKMLA